MIFGLILCLFFFGFFGICVDLDVNEHLDSALVMHLEIIFWCFARFLCKHSFVSFNGIGRISF